MVPQGRGLEPHSCHIVCLCRDMQPHMAGTLQSKGRDDLSIFSTQTPLMILVSIKCSKSSRPSFSSSWPRKPGRQSCVEGCPCCRAPVRVKNCVHVLAGTVALGSISGARTVRAWARTPQLSLRLCRDMQPHMAGTLQSKGRDHIFNTNTSYDSCVYKMLKCAGRELQL